MNNIIVEEMNENDALKIAEIESELISKISKDSIIKSLNNKNLHYFLLKKDNEILGFLQCLILKPESELYEIGIQKKYQGNGYSKFLMDYYFDYLKNIGCETIFLEVNNINNVAINLYKKYGFVEYSKRKNYYGDNDAILMKRDI